MTIGPPITTSEETTREATVLGKVRSSWITCRSDCLCLAIILLFFVVFFWRIPLRGELPLIGDPMAYSYPMRVVAWDMIRSGSLPLWTPFIFSGYPLLSMAQLGLGYPLTWVYLFLPGHWAETLYVIAPFLLAPAFLYAYVRTLGRSRTAALLAGLSFAYGGMMGSKLSNGMLPNAVMWLPLLLIAIERSRRGRFLLCLVGGATAYSMSVLTGIGQGIVMTGLIAGGYAVFVAATDLRQERWGVLRPIGVAAGAAILALGVASFQIFESWPVVRLSVRSELTYEIFGQLSLPIWRAFLALWIPIYYHIESAPYLPPLVLGLAIVGVVTALRKPGANHQALFWVVVAVISAVLIPGTYTPIYRLLYQIPILNKFRGASRHSFGWTLGLSILGAYGWDALSILRARLAMPRRESLIAVGMSVSAALSLLVAWLWMRDVAVRVPILSEAALSEATRSYWLFKVAFVILTSIGLWCIWRMRCSSVRDLLLAGCLSWMCFVEPSLFMVYSWSYPAIPGSWFEAVRPPTRFLKEYATGLERIYLRVVGFDARDLEPRNLDFLNLAARHKLQNIAGYEPLILQRYSSALGDVWLDGVRGKLASPADFSLFDPRSHVLDLLSTSVVVGYSNLEVSLPSTIEKEGVRFAASDFPRDRSTRLSAIVAEGDTLAIVSLLSHSTAVADGTPVARLTIRALDGRTIERELLAGRDTSEWAHERPEVLRRVRHRLAPVFDKYPGDANGSFDAYQFLSRIPLGERVDLDRIEISELIPGVPVTVVKATMVGEDGRKSTPLIGLKPDEGPSEFGWLRDGARWEKVYDRDEVLMLKNKRALPRAWLVGSARVVSDGEALRQIRGLEANAFNPRETVLLENTPPELGSLPGASLPAQASARVTRFAANQLTIDTECATAAILVSSEINYPGWEATVDGQATNIYTANYLLRAIPLGPGVHRVEMRYRAPGARRGALISICTILLLGGMLLSSRRRRKKG